LRDFLCILTLLYRDSGAGNALRLCRSFTIALQRTADDGSTGYSHLENRSHYLVTVSVKTYTVEQHGILVSVAVLTEVAKFQ